MDVDKGCYQGQEGVASLLKNKRGLQRSLYSVFFPEDDNFYEGQEDKEEYSNHRSVFRTRQKSPRVGDELFVIKVGVITSIAERGGTSLPETVGMALVRRAEGILNKMKRMDLEIERNLDDGTGMILPPPMDPLDGLEVVLGNGFTSRRLRRGQNLFEVEQR